MIIFTSKGVHNGEVRELREFLTRFLPLVTWDEVFVSFLVQF